DQRAGYMAYLEVHFQRVLKEEKLSWLDVAKNETVLSVRDPRLPFGMSGTADVLLVDCRSTQHLEPLAGVRMVVELKKKVEERHKPQAFGELVAASLKAPLNCTPIGLLTDLNDQWHVSWFNAEKALTHVSLTHPKNAFDFIAAFIAEPGSATSFRVPFIDRPLAKLKIDDFLPQPDDGADEMMERYELMADVVEHEFLMARRVEYAQHLVQSMPMYAHMYTSQSLLENLVAFEAGVTITDCSAGHTTTTMANADVHVCTVSTASSSILNNHGGSSASAAAESGNATLTRIRHDVRAPPGDEALDFVTTMETLETGDPVFFRRKLSALHTWAMRRQLNPRFDHWLLNNVVIGVTHARLYPWIRKVAVLDWDIHHGNGTEDLLKDDPDAFFASIHLYSSGWYFPGTGESCETVNLINVALENTGAGSGSQAFRSALENKVLPAMRAFGPDIIFLSAGFDGHRDDILGGAAAMKNPNVPAGYMEEDYAWTTLEILKLAAEVCDGRVVSALESGYDVRKETSSLAKSAAAHVAAISAYETARRLTTESSSAGVDKSATGATEAATTIQDAVVKAEAPVKPEPVVGELLGRLLATELDDGNVIIIDDDESQEESGEAGHETRSGAEEEEEEGLKLKRLGPAGAFLRQAQASKSAAVDPKRLVDPVALVGNCDDIDVALSLRRDLDEEEPQQEAQELDADAATSFLSSIRRGLDELAGDEDDDEDEDEEDDEEGEYYQASRENTYYSPEQKLPSELLLAAEDELDLSGTSTASSSLAATAALATANTGEAEDEDLMFQLEM
ncbi:hypothetical protein BBJ28_00023032, partial [Nothophytophthora sp. Chile5]